jgi:hypothetical protein
MEEKTITDKRVKRAPEHYVNNREFSEAVAEYVRLVKEASVNEDIDDIPKIPDYVGICIMKICEGLSHKPNFIDYSFREDMVYDGISNCLAKITNFNPDAETRSGYLNAFAYLTQIAMNAFIRRIKKEQKHREIRDALIENSDLSEFAETDADGTDYGISNRAKTYNDN